MFEILFWYIYIYGDNILGGSVRTIMKNSDVSVVARKETGLEVNADEV